MEALIDSVVGKLYGKDVTVTDLSNHPEMIQNPNFIPIEQWSLRKKVEWKCLYCNSLNSDEIYICNMCGAPKQ